ncbi:unnamed protein product [Linum trigynum]|uniref:RNase H type-1 domain-containing protein n=1 Tax=Linum trigynum TaxID=586398 RepID=A0AAV2GTT1_9ROSI
MNTDAAVLGEEGTGFEMVIRNGDGTFQMVVVHRTRKKWPPETAEALVVLRGLKLAKSHHFVPLIVETDCKSLVQKLDRRDSTAWEIGGICDEIKELAEEDGNVRWRFWGRAGNECAHLMTRIRCRPEESEILFNRAPIFLIPQLSKDGIVVPELS